MRTVNLITAFSLTVAATSFTQSSASADAGDAVGGFITGVITKTFIDNLSQKDTRTYRRTTTRSQPVDPAVRQYWMGIQVALNNIGYDAGPVDGVPGRRTKDALRAFQISIGAAPTASLTPDQYQLLMVKSAPVQPGIIVTENGPTSENVNDLDAKQEVTVNVEVDPGFEALRQSHEELVEQVRLLTELRSRELSLDSELRSETRISMLDAQLSKSKNELLSIEETASSRYTTPIRPENKNESVSAYKASEYFLKVPYYIPGTTDKGEFSIEPKIKDTGELMYLVQFIDIQTEFDDVIETIELSPADVDVISGGLRKIGEWTETARQNSVRKNFEKVAACFPLINCNGRKAGISSTEIVFVLYDDGSTAGQIRRNKGLSQFSYSMSYESSALLDSYLSYISEISKKDYEGSMQSPETLDKLFQ